MLADMIRAFCNEPDNDYEVCENYSGRTMLGETVITLGIIVKQDRNIFDVLDQLGSYLEAKGFNDPSNPMMEEFEGTATDLIGSDTIVYFPGIRDYQPPQP
ncbi:hypothetical protein [uncultured Oscillibacter sp.]|uniref:hypothetical protein n=1 Tax=uncultured Oscillibacter sp. TaxID=876091 RepID=UPI002608522A|nr:hypothetical protein [uncultured Oscillibacter sp.]